jgi:hypothetical protein
MKAVLKTIVWFFAAIGWGILTANYIQPVATSFIVMLAGCFPIALFFTWWLAR